MLCHTKPARSRSLWLSIQRLVLCTGKFCPATCCSLQAAHIDGAGLAQSFEVSKTTTPKSTAADDQVRIVHCLQTHRGLLFFTTVIALFLRQHFASVSGSNKFLASIWPARCDISRQLMENIFTARSSGSCPYSSVTHRTSKGSKREYRSGSARRSGTRTFCNGLQGS